MTSPSLYPHIDQNHSVLLTATPELRNALRETLAHDMLAGWQVVETESLERAHFLLQHGYSDVWLIDDRICWTNDENGLVWLTGRRQTPVLFLADPDPGRLIWSQAWGCEQWLVRDLATQPGLLRVALEQAVRWGELHRNLHRYGEELLECRRRVNSLADMLWQSVPEERGDGCLPQRHVLLRLQEEINRAERHGTPLTLVLGEMRDRAEPAPGGPPVPVAPWAFGLINQTKRRCDVLGRYGPNSFLLLLVQTGTGGADVFCQRLRRAFQERVADGSGQGLPFRLAFGLAAHTSGTTALHLLSLGERSLEQAWQTE
jgi:hypothetical protein